MSKLIIIFGLLIVAYTVIAKVSGMPTFCR